MSSLAEFAPSGLHEFLEDSVKALPRRTAALDIGCASGAWLRRLKDLGFHDLWGLDVDVRAKVTGVSYVHADLDGERRSLERKFGLITAIEVIEHLANPGALLWFISNHLADDGIAIVTSPNIQSLRYRLKFLLTGKMPSFDEKGEPSHVSPLLLAGFRRVAARFDLDIVRCWTYPAQGSVMFRGPMRSAAFLLRFLLPDHYPGDSICVQLARCAGPRS